MALTIISVSDPVYANVAQSLIDCTLTTAELGVIPFTVNENDYQLYSQALWVDLLNGEYGAIGAYVAPAVPPAQQAAAAIAAGVVITSTGTPALNGTYSIDQTAQNNINAIVTFILRNNTFPGGTTMPWVDLDGNVHLWPSVTEFDAFATAVANYVAAVSIYALSGGTAGSLPSNAITIP